MMNLPRQINHLFEQWLRAPEPNAAGRMSIYRIVYGLFFLTSLPALSSYSRIYGTLPDGEWQPIISIAGFNPPPPPQLLLQIVPLVLAFSLVLVILGLWTRWATLAVLISAVYLGIIFFSYKGKIDHGDTYLVAYIPMIMLFARWNSNYSIDAVLRHRRSGEKIDPQNSSWVYVWPMRAVILLLSLMFFGAGATKIAGDWVTDMSTLSDIFLDANRMAVLAQNPPSALNLALAQIPLVMMPLQFMGILIQLLFPLNLINRRFRTLFFASMVFFHLFNRQFVFLNTYKMLVVYLIVVDWEALVGRRLPRSEWFNRISSPALVGTGIAAAAFITLLATSVSFIDVLPFRHYGLWIAAPIALFLVLRASVAILREDILPRITRRQTRTIPPAHRPYS